MQITVLSVSKTQHMTKANKPYFQLEVAYKGEDGQVKGKKLMPFGSSKPAFDSLVAAQSGEAWDISLVKEGEYWTWTAAKKSDGTTSAPSTSSSPAPTTSTSYQGAKGNIDTQRYIVRQSSIANAINLRKSETANVEEILEVARIFEAFVFREETKAKTNPVATPSSDFSDMGDDIPL